MANRETYPASFSPLVGDVSAGAGAVAVVVTGLQTYPVQPTTPLDQQVLKFTADVSQPHGGSWGPATLSTSSMVQVNGSPVSDDSEVFINGLDSIDGMVLPITVNTAPQNVAVHLILVNNFPVSNDEIVTINNLSSILGVVRPITVNAPRALFIPNHAILVNLFPVSDDYTITANVTRPVLINGV